MFVLYVDEEIALQGDLLTADVSRQIPVTGVECLRLRVTREDAAIGERDVFINL